MSIMLAQHQSDPLVEELNMLTAINLLSGANQFFSVLMDAAVLACSFPRLSLIVKYNQFYSEMRKCQSVFL